VTGVQTCALPIYFFLPFLTAPLTLVRTVFCLGSEVSWSGSEARLEGTANQDVDHTMRKLELTYLSSFCFLPLHLQILEQRFWTFLVNQPLLCPRSGWLTLQKQLTGPVFDLMFIEDW